MNTDLVKKSYNKIASSYQNQREFLKNGKYLNKFLQLLQPQSFILDLGCGSGDPIDTQLIKNGHLVIGLDISPVQIYLARKNCPTGSFSVADIQNLKPKEYLVDAVVSFYTFFHVSREKHLDLLRTVNSFLPIGGPLLLTMGDKDFEGFHTMYGEQMWSSHFEPQKNTKLLIQAGFKIILDQIDTSGEEKHQVLLAKKIKNCI